MTCRREAARGHQGGARGVRARAVTQGWRGCADLQQQVLEARTAMRFSQLGVVVMMWSLQQTTSTGDNGSGEERRQCTRDWAPPLEPDTSLRTPAPDAPGIQPRKLRMDNTCAEPMVVMWVNEHGEEVQVKRLEPGRRLSTATTGGAVFRAYFVDGADQPVQLALEHKVSRLDPRMRHVDIAPCGVGAKRFEIAGAHVKINRKPKTDDSQPQGSGEPDVVRRELLQQDLPDEEAPDGDDVTVVVVSVVGCVATILGFLVLSAVLPRLGAQMEPKSPTRRRHRLRTADSSTNAALHCNLQPPATTPELCRYNNESPLESSASESETSASSDSSEEDEDIDTDKEVVVVREEQPEDSGAVRRLTHVQGFVVTDAAVSPLSSVHELSKKLEELGGRDRRLAQLIQDGRANRAWCSTLGA